MNRNFIKILSLFLFLFLHKTNAQEKFVEPESWKFPQIIESARIISPTNIEGIPFNEGGIAYSLQVLKKLNISSMKARELQKYADIVTHAYPDALAKQFPKSCDKININKINETTFANLAFISLRGKKKESREKAQNCLFVLQKSLLRSKNQY